MNDYLNGFLWCRPTPQNGSWRFLGGPLLFSVLFTSPEQFFQQPPFSHSSSLQHLWYFTFHFHGIWFLILFESTFDSHHSLMLHSYSSDGAIHSGYLLGGSFGCLNLVFAATFSPLYFENEFARILTGKEEAISMGILQPLALVWLMTIIS